MTGREKEGERSRERVIETGREGEEEREWTRGRQKE